MNMNNKRNIPCSFFTNDICWLIHALMAAKLNEYVLLFGILGIRGLPRRWWCRLWTEWKRAAWREVNCLKVPNFLCPTLIQLFCSFSKQSCCWAGSWTGARQSPWPRPLRWPPRSSRWWWWWWSLQWQVSLPIAISIVFLSQTQCPDFCSVMLPLYIFCFHDYTHNPIWPLSWQFNSLKI